MEDIKIPDLLTPEIIEALASNAETIKSALAYEESEDDKAALSEHNDCKKCCCPKFLKFKFLFCHVVIINKNAECQKKDYDRSYSQPAEKEDC